MLTELQIKKNVHMENELRLVLNRSSKHLEKILYPYIGEKVTNKSGGFCKKIKVQIDFEPFKIITALQTDHFADCQLVYADIGSSCIFLNAALCFNGGGYETKDYYCHYPKDSYYIAKIADGKLAKVNRLNLPMLDPRIERNNYLTAYGLQQQFKAINGKLMKTHQLK